MANTNSQGGGTAKAKGKSKGKILNLEELFIKDVGSGINWAEEVENEAQNVGGPTTTTTVEIKTKFTHARMSLPSAPKASRGDVIIDMDKLPVDGPYVAYMGNIAYNANDRSIEEFFTPLNVLNIRTITDNGRPKGYCYIEFGSRQELAEALKRNNERLVGRPVKIDLADQDRTGERKKSYEQHPSGQQRRDSGSSGGRQRYSVPGDGGQAESATDWRAESRPYGPPPPVHTMSRDRGPPPPQQEMHPYHTMPAGRPPAAPYANPRYGNDRPDYANRPAYGQHPPPGPPQASQPYGNGPPSAGGYYPPPYGDPVGGSAPSDQRYYPTDHRKRRDNDYGGQGRYNTMGARPTRERDPRYDQGYESERDQYYDQSNYRYRQPQQEYGVGPNSRIGPPHHRGSGPPTPNAGYPIFRHGSQSSYGGGYGSDSEAAYRQKGEVYARGGQYQQQQFPAYQQQQQQPFRMYQDSMDSGDGRRGGAPPRRDYGVAPRGAASGVRPARREHRTSTASTVSVDESICEGETPKERRKLQLQPRTKPVAEVAAPIEKSSSGIFGNAKPIDTRQVEEKIEEKIRKQNEETKKRGSVTTSASETDIGALQKLGSHRNSSVNSSRSSPVEDPKPSITPTAMAPDEVKLAPAAQITILRRRTTSSQNDSNESSMTTTLKSDENPIVITQHLAADKPADQAKFSNENNTEKSSDNIASNNRGGERRRGDSFRHRGGGGGSHHNGHRGGGGRMYADRPPRFQDAKFQDDRSKDFERRGSQDSLIFTRGGGGRNKGRRGFPGPGGGQGRGRSFDEGDTKAYQHLDPQHTAPVHHPPNNNVRRQNSHKHSIDRQDSKLRQDDDSQMPPAQQQLQRKKSRENKPVEKKPSSAPVINDDPPSYTDVNKFSLLQTMSEDE